MTSKTSGKVKTKPVRACLQAVYKTTQSLQISSVAYLFVTSSPGGSLKRERNMVSKDYNTGNEDSLTEINSGPPNITHDLLGLQIWLFLFLFLFCYILLYTVEPR